MFLEEIRPTDKNQQTTTIAIMTIYWCDPETSNSLLIPFLLIIDCLCFARLQKGNWTQGVCFGWTVWRLEDSCGDNIGQTLWRVSNRACSSHSLRGRGSGHRSTYVASKCELVFGFLLSLQENLSQRWRWSGFQAVWRTPTIMSTMITKCGERWARWQISKNQKISINVLEPHNIKVLFIVLVCFVFQHFKQYTLPEGSMKDMNEF